MRLLSIDTSSNLLSVALAEDDSIIASESLLMERGQGEALIPIIQKLFISANWDISTLNQVLAAIGPGSFTGVRIALAAARGIGLSLNIPVLGMTNFNALITPDMPYPLCVALDTKRGDCYVQIFESYQKAQAPQIMSLSEIVSLNLPVVTDKSDLFENEAVQCLEMPACSAANMIHVANSKPDVLQNPDPLYLRDADVTVSTPCGLHAS